MEIRFSMGDDERYLTLAPNEIWVVAVARAHCRFNIVRKGVFATEIQNRGDYIGGEREGAVLLTMHETTLLPFLSPRRLDPIPRGLIESTLRPAVARASVGTDAGRLHLCAVAITRLRRREKSHTFAGLRRLPDHRRALDDDTPELGCFFFFKKNPRN